MIGGLVLLFCRILIIFIIGLFIFIPLSKCLFKLSYKQFKVEKKDFVEFMKKESEELYKHFNCNQNNISPQQKIKLEVYNILKNIDGVTRVSEPQKVLLSIKLSDLCNLKFYIDFENDNDAFVEMLDIKYLKDEDTILNFILSNAKFSIYNKKHILQTLIELLEKNYKFSNDVKNSIKKHFENKKRTKLDKLNAIAHELCMSCVDCKNLDNCKSDLINYPCKKIKGILNNER